MMELALQFTHAAAQVLWLGALVALAVFAAERMLIRTAAGRHAASLFGLVLTMLFLPITFFMAPVKVERPALPRVEVQGKAVVVPATAGVEPAGTAEDTAQLHQERAVEAGESVNAEPVLSSLEAEPGGRWERIAPWVAGWYLVGLFGMVLRMVCGFAGSARLRRRSDPVDAGLWIEALQRMGDAVKVRVRPVLKWSREVAAPVVIGFVKPVILLPIALASRLSPAQVEAVLAHELAHLRRGDTWALAVQRVVETILFFHPAVWWMSHRMEVAREEACDDLVLAAGCDPADYAEALVVCSECRLEQKGFSGKFTHQLAATGNGKERLRRRVLRLIGGGDGGAIRLGWAGWVLGLFLVGGVTLAVMAGSARRADLADFDFDNPPGAYERSIKAADRNQRFTADGIQFQASPLQWGKEGWLLLPKEEQGPGEELFLNLGVSGGYEIVEIRLFDHATRELIHDSAWQQPGNQSQDFFVQRIGSGNWLRMKETGGMFPEKIDVWLRIVTSRPGNTIVLRAEDGALAQWNGIEVVVTSLLEGVMNGRGSDPGGGMIWDLSSAHDRDRATTVNIENRGNILRGRYHLVAVNKDGSRHPMNHTHFWDFGRMNRHAYFQMDVALADVEHFELIPFKDRHKFFFNGLKVPTKVPADIDGFGVAVADAVVRVIKTQNLPFLGNQRLQNLHVEFAALVQTHCGDDLSDGRKRAILAAIRDNGAKHLFLNRYRPDDVGSLNQAYLEFPDLIKTLEWKVFMAITRPPLARDELARLESQRQWIRDIIAGLPDDRPVSRKDVLVSLETYFDDPFTTPFDRAMNEAQFARFQNAITTWMREAQAGVEEHTPTSVRSIKPHNPLPFVLNHLVAEALRAQYMGENHENLFPLFDDDPVGSSGARNGYIHLGFMSNRMFRGDTRGLQEKDYSAIDATTGIPISAPSDQLEPAKFLMWVEAQDKGDFRLSREADNGLVAVRRAKLALLNVTNWIEADAIPNDELRAIIEKQNTKRIGLSSYYEAHLNGHSTFPPTEFIGPYIGVMTKEGRLAVVHIEDFSGREQILYRVRPRE
jgi:Zn-dependent protease with chaperone function